MRSILLTCFAFVLICHLADGASARQRQAGYARKLSDKVKAAAVRQAWEFKQGAMQNGVHIVQHASASKDGLTAACELYTKGSFGFVYSHYENETATDDTEGDTEDDAADQWWKNEWWNDKTKSDDPTDDPSDDMMSIDISTSGRGRNGGMFGRIFNNVFGKRDLSKRSAERSKRSVKVKTSQSHTGSDNSSGETSVPCSQNIQTQAKQVTVLVWRNVSSDCTISQLKLYNLDPNADSTAQNIPCNDKDPSVFQIDGDSDGIVKMYLAYASNGSTENGEFLLYWYAGGAAGR